MAESMSIEKKTALVTGAARRLGRAIALALAKAGVNVVVHYHTSRDDAEELVALIADIGVNSWAVCANLEDPTEADTLLSKATDTCGSIDILINNAAIFPEDKLMDLTPEMLNTNININALAPLILSRSFRAQQRRGDIINILDARIFDYDKEHTAYHLSKRTLFSLTRMMAVEFAPEVRVNGIAPGLILPPKGRDETYLESLKHTNPLNMYGAPEDVARAVLFLIESPFITGQIICVDGGRHMRGSMYD